VACAWKYKSTGLRIRRRKLKSWKEDSEAHIGIKLPKTRRQEKDNIRTGTPLISPLVTFFNSLLNAEE